MPPLQYGNRIFWGAAKEVCKTGKFLSNITGYMYETGNNKTRRTGISLVPSRFRALPATESSRNNGRIRARNSKTVGFSEKESPTVVWRTAPRTEGKGVTIQSEYGRKSSEEILIDRRRHDCLPWLAGGLWNVGDNIPHHAVTCAGLTPARRTFETRWR